jgi:cellulose synthase/poly-beta-1,6-N-acetylglucosamine synthase-like glycosyltransferase
MMEIIFWFSLLMVLYTYIGYGIVLKILSFFIPTRITEKPEEHFTPTITHIVACYNEEDIIEEKLNNSKNLTYPKSQLTTIFVTDGSNDGTADLVSNHKSDIIHSHQNERKGKLHAVNRILSGVKSDIIVFSDANALLNRKALVKIAAPFQNVNVGAVSGEKRVSLNNHDDASSAGESFYWKYESTLKALDSRVYTVVGAAGELFAIRTELYVPPPANSLIEDFITSMTVAKSGYRVAYQPDAYAVEKSSESLEEELKRKVRISAGGLQSIILLKGLLNPFKYGILSFQYLSHRVMRWTLAPISLITLCFSNIFLAGNNPFYFIILVSQVLFYSAAILGWLLSKKKVKLRLFFIPFYFTFMNFSVFLGLIKFIKGDYQVIWDKAKRKQ